MTALSARAQILALGQRHAVDLTLREMDHLALAITRLADDTPDSDDVTLTLIRLAQANVLSAPECQTLLLNWLAESRVPHVA